MSENTGPWPGAPVRLARFLVPFVYVACGLAFLSDVNRANTLAYGLFYTPLIATAVFHRRNWGLWVLCVATIACVIIGAFLPAVDPDLPDLVGNRVLSILAILATAAFVRFARATQDRLSAQRRRAEAAEQVKSAVFRNLSEEIRTPLHSLIGIMSLLKAGARPDQITALAQVEGGARQLVATIDNLIALTQFDEQPLQETELDVRRIVRAAAEHARGAADEHDLSIRVDPPAVGTADDAVRALGDARAVRRIVDNLLAMTMQTAWPGQTVSVAVTTVGADVITHVTAITADGADGATGRAPAANELLRAGLTLSEQLAQSMRGHVRIDESSTSGPRLSLYLPAA